MHRYNIIKDKSMTKTLFMLCWIVYFTSYIGRLNYSSAMPALISENVVTASQAGAISMAYFFAYGIGQFINGFLGDKINPGKMIFIGLLLSGVVNFLMGMQKNFWAMAIFWCINGYSQSMIWPPIIYIFAEMMENDERVKSCVNITSSMAIGTLTSYFLSATMITLWGWRAVFFAAASVLCTVAVIFIIKFHQVENYVAIYGQPHVISNDMETKYNQKETVRISFSKVAFTSGLLAILIPVIVHGVLKDGMTTWVPTYISETFQTSAAMSILLTAVLPIVNLIGAYWAQYMYRRFFKRKEIKTAVFFFCIAGIALFLLWRVSSISMIFTVVLLAVVTTSMMGVNTLFINLIPLHFERVGRVASVSGFLNSMAYLGTAVSTFLIGILVEKTGWDATIFCWFIMTIVALIVCLWRSKEELSE